jgi:hypothetical protein
VWEGAGIYAVRETEHWRKGFDPEKYVQHKLTSLKTASRDASKVNDPDAVPQFWVYDKSTKKVLVVREGPDGKLVVGEPTGKGAKAIDPVKYEKVKNASGKTVKKPVLDQDGDPVLRDEIDVVVEDHGVERLRMEIYKQMIERLDAK